jgi:hypothetical protein
MPHAIARLGAEGIGFSVPSVFFLYPPVYPDEAELFEGQPISKAEGHARAQVGRGSNRGQE